MRTNRDIAAFLVVLATLLLVASTALGQECRQRTLSRQPHFLPNGQFCETSAGEMTCFTLEEYKKLLKLDAEHAAEKEKTVEKDKIISNQGLVIQQKDIVIKSLESDNKVLSGQVDRIGMKWQTCLDEQEGVPWSSIGLGAGVGVITGVIAGVVAYLAISSVK